MRPKQPLREYPFIKDRCIQLCMVTYRTGMVGFSIRAIRAGIIMFLLPHALSHEDLSEALMLLLLLGLQQPHPASPRTQRARKHL